MSYHIRCLLSHSASFISAHKHNMRFCFGEGILPFPCHPPDTTHSLMCWLCLSSHYSPWHAHSPAFEISGGFSGNIWKLVFWNSIMKFEIPPAEQLGWMFIISLLGKWRQEDQKFQSSLSYIVKLKQDSKTICFCSGFGTHREISGSVGALCKVVSRGIFGAFVRQPASARQWYPSLTTPIASRPSRSFCVTVATLFCDSPVNPASGFLALLITHLVWTDFKSNQQKAVSTWL